MTPATSAFRPNHPGFVLATFFLEPLNMTQREAAVRLHVSELELRSFIAGNVPLSFGLAKQLAKEFKTSIHLWINLQRNHDDWQP